VTAAIGLALSTAPDVAHTLTFLRRLTTLHGLVPGLATTLAPAVAAVLFITVTVALINCEYICIPAVNGSNTFGFQGQATSMDQCPSPAGSWLSLKRCFSS
jgi:hypothetical protein